ncbi:OmpA family protein [Kineosporia sp. J2-2]|uniref:OmpA family protein n=1 Tax=Kineosporia corallincola TaxID=2835133 RepID=A0ABS5TNG3_9ACTN|nr:OmpA family protein [Kineosporia corallincola]MBT0772638.1 OmpA family protein [Kineosporia corallincola]
MVGRIVSVLAGALCLVSGQLLMPAAQAATPDSGSAWEQQRVPVLGSVTMTESQESGGARATVLVNGVRRIDGATVVYFSGGLPAGSGPVSWASFTRSRSDRLREVYTYIGQIRLVDFENRQIYLPLVREAADGGRNDEVLASPEEAWPADESGGTFYTFYAVMPELPADLKTVDVMVGNGDMVHDVAVGDGVLEPAVEQTGPIRLGEGWPQIDQAAAAASFQPEQSVYPLDTETSDLEQTVTARSDSDSTSVDLAADVLFEVDSAELGGEAGPALEKAAKQVNESAAGGRIEIAGHTDDTGGDAHNLDLSKRRAQAVADELEPLITVSGVTFTVSGKGEADPVATNGTDEGRKKNRRVSVVFSPKDGK